MTMKKTVTSRLQAAVGAAKTTLTSSSSSTHYCPDNELACLLVNSLRIL
jgi:hypothetical protein